MKTSAVTIWCGRATWWKPPAACSRPGRWPEAVHSTAGKAYLQTTQEADGHWGQNMWLDGTPYWIGIQMDETALPILLVDLCLREGALAERDLPRFWPMVRRAAAYIVSNGPVSPQDRFGKSSGCCVMEFAVHRRH